MTTYMDENQRCHVCGASVECVVIGSTNAFGSCDLDLRPPEMKRSTMHRWLQECPQCHYVNYDLRESIPGAQATLQSAAYVALMADATIPELARSFARYALLQHADPEAAGAALLRAAWACDDVGDVQRAAEYRSAAADHLLALRPLADDQQQTTLATSVVDILRRAGRIDEALALAQTLLSLSSVKKDEIVDKVVRYQVQLCDAQDVGCHTVADCM